MSWNLPESLNISGSFFSIRTDYRDILTILRAYNDPDLDDQAKAVVMLQILYKDWQKLKPDDLEEAINKGIEFIDCGHTEEDTGRAQPRLMDWDQDSDLIVPAVNKVAGMGDIRALPYMHWWTFLSYYNAIEGGIFSEVISIRWKQSKGKKLEKHEQEFLRENRKLIRLDNPKSEEDLERERLEKEALKELFGE